MRGISTGARLDVKALGLTSNLWRDLYFNAFRARTPHIFAVFVAIFMIFNLAFAVLYSLDPDSIGGRDASLPPFVEAFFFSVHTSATVGYGNMFPKSIYANVLVVIEIMTGILFIAVSTGFAYARFSRPIARILFSERAVIADYDGVPTLMFRCANQRLNMILQASVKVYVLRSEFDAHGREMRRLHDLPLLRSDNPTFVLSWTVMHPITDKSPIRHWQPGEAEHEDEIIVALTGVDESLLQPIYARYAYAHDDVVWNARFADILGEDTDGRRTLDYRKFHKLEAIE